MLRTLQAAYPDTAFTWIVGRTEAALVGDLPGVEFITFDKRSGIAGMRAVRARIGARRFDVLLHMQVAIRASLLSAFVPAARRIGYDFARARDGQWLFARERIAARPREHVMDALFGFAAALGAHERVLRWDIPVAANVDEFARTAIPDGGRTLIISPCASSPVRNWRIERYAAIADHAHRVHGMRVLLTGGPGETDRAAGAALAARCPYASNLVGATTLKQLYALLRRATVLLAPDSGPVHMATAAGTPVIGLYAVSNPDRTGPYFHREYTVNRYPDALGVPVDSVRWGRRVRDNAAMDLITVDDVIARLDRLVAERC